MTNLIGQRAQDFIVPAIDNHGATIEEFSLLSPFKNGYGVLFFYPHDFTFVCPSEIIALNNRVAKFRTLNAAVVGISIDSHYTHLAYRNTPVEHGGIGPVNFTLASDMDRAVSTAYGVRSANDESFYRCGASMRATFVIDPQGIIRHQVINDLPVGRNMDEIVRVIEALRMYAEKGHVCPAGWKNGDEGIAETTDGIATYLSRYWKQL